MTKYVYEVRRKPRREATANTFLAFCGFIIDAAADRNGNVRLKNDFVVNLLSLHINLGIEFY